MHWLTYLRPQLPVAEEIGAFLQSQDVAGNITLSYLKYKMLSDLGLYAQDTCQTFCNADTVSDIFLENLQTATPWIVKAVNIRLLSDRKSVV